ncbi:MAG: hypothetical protein AAF489_15220 [Bacteroidota bacterium]
MKVLRFVLLLAGLALIGWSAMDYFSDIPKETEQATAKVILGILCVLASFLAKNRR